MASRLEIANVRRDCLSAKGAPMAHIDERGRFALDGHQRRPCDSSRFLAQIAAWFEGNCTWVRHNLNPVGGQDQAARDGGPPVCQNALLAPVEQ